MVSLFVISLHKGAPAVLRLSGKGSIFLRHSGGYAIFVPESRVPATGLYRPELGPIIFLYYL